MGVLNPPDILYILHVPVFPVFPVSNNTPEDEPAEQRKIRSLPVPEKLTA